MLVRGLADIRLPIWRKHVLNAAFTRVAKKVASWHGATMKQSKPRQAGGVLLALGFTVGAVIGVVLGEPSAGFLIGGGIGLALALLIWWRDRR